ncbi:MAG TPA: peptidoglycan DD-metalloendopeptidase family protein, partial [Rhodothermales bacterium]|nr:peptidoglycan DD-metalloendopeptidase family protein [Rhodothermales bacterium]
MRIRTLLKVSLFVIGIAVAAWFLVGRADPSQTLQTVELTPPPPPPPPSLDEFGLAVDGVKTEDADVRRSQTLSEILSDYGVTPETIHDLAQKSDSVFDVTTLNVGKPYRAYTSHGQLQYLVYEPNDVDYVVFDLTGSMSVRTDSRPVEISRHTASGVIDGSLYGSLVESGADPAIATKLADVFAWQVDFYHIQKGDRFSVLYEDRKVDGETIGTGKILAAHLTSYGEDYYAFYFDEGDVSGYFDEKGESLRRAFLKSPLKYSHITSHYSLHRYHPIQKRMKAHLGTDFAAPTGTPIMSTGDGVVIEARYKRYNGNYVKIRHNSTYTTQYLHMSHIAKGMHPGVHVTQGQVIGYVGSTGLATGPHVCYRFWKNGKQVDPFKQDLPSADPIPDQYRASYMAVRDQLMPSVGAPVEAAPPVNLAAADPASRP